MKKLILMLATIGAITFANAQTAPANGAKPAGTPTPAVADPNAPDFKWETKNIDYGTVTKGDETNSTRYFKFTNVGKSPLIISSCHGSCGCTVPSCPTESILPGKEGSIKVHYDINRPGNFTKTVTVSSNAKDGNVTLQITGKVEDKTPATPAPTPAAPVKK